MWNSELALNDLWDVLDLSEPRGQIRMALKAHLWRAYNAGWQDAARAERLEKETAEIR